MEPITSLAQLADRFFEASQSQDPCKSIQLFLSVLKDQYSPPPSPTTSSPDISASQPSEEIAIHALMLNSIFHRALSDPSRAPGEKEYRCLLPCHHALELYRQWAEDKKAELTRLKQTPPPFPKEMVQLEQYIHTLLSLPNPENPTIPQDLLFKIMEAKENEETKMFLEQSLDSFISDLTKLIEETPSQSSDPTPMIGILAEAQKILSEIKISGISIKTAKEQLYQILSRTQAQFDAISRHIGTLASAKLLQTMITQKIKHPLSNFLSFPETIVKARMRKGEVQVIIKSFLAEGGQKTLVQLTRLSGPSISPTLTPIAPEEIPSREELSEMALLKANFAYAKPHTPTPESLEALKKEFEVSAAIRSKSPHPDSRVLRMELTYHEKSTGPGSPKGLLMPLYDSTLSSSTPRSYPDEVLHIATQVVEAIADVHVANFTHGDIKDANFLVRSAEPLLSEVVLSDFGYTVETGTIVGAKGSLLYMAPERLGDEIPACESLDIWSLGIVLFNIRYGEDKNSLITHLEEMDSLERYQAFEQWKQDLPGEIRHFKEKLRANDPYDKIILDCLSEDPTLRPTAQNILGRLGELRNNPVTFIS